MDTTLKDMLVSSTCSRHRDMLSCVTQIRAEVEAIGDKISHVENKIREFVMAHNELMLKMRWRKNLKQKLVDFEDRSRRNYFKFS